MIREEELKKQASIYTDDADNYLEYSDDRGWTDKNDKEFVEKAFIEGANWADKNPKSPWISVEEDLPCNHDELFINNDKKETKTVLVIINGYIMMSRMYKPKHKWRWNSDEPTYWMRIPEITENGRIRPL